MGIWNHSPMNLAQNKKASLEGCFFVAKVYFNSNLQINTKFNYLNFSKIILSLIINKEKHPV
jgi:hypothetical protein